MDRISISKKILPTLDIFSNFFDHAERKYYD